MWQWLERLIHGSDSINYSDQTLYQANDPSTPDLRITVQLPPRPTPLQINVVGFRGTQSSWGTPEMDATCVYVTCAKSIEHIQKLNNGPQKWAAVKILEAHPRAGRQMNAYYDRKALRFFYDQDPRNARMLFLCESSDVVAHELGHALLDAMRPDFWNVSALEIWSFHEAFADINAVMATGQFDQVLDKALSQNSGNMHKSNVLSMLAEEVGAALGIKGGLRNAVNTFKYVNPDTLPVNAPYDQLARECHSFGRVFLGAWYEMMANMYDLNKTTMPPKTALKMAMDDAFMLMLRAIPKAPRIPRFTEAIAKIMETLAPARYKDIVHNTFVARQLLPATHMQSFMGMKWEDFAKRDKPIVAFISEQDKSRFVTIPGRKTMRLATHIPDKHIHSLTGTGYNLANAEVEVASDSYYEFDPEGNLVYQIIPEEAEVVDATRLALSSITSIGPYEDTMWAVKRDKLVRTYFE